MRKIFAPNLIACLSALMMSFLFGLPGAAETGRPLPTQIDDCVQTTIREILVADGTNKAAVWKLFKRHVDTNWLGAAAYGNAWKNAEPAWKEEAVHQYFDLLFMSSQKVSGGARLIDGSVKSWLPTTKPERGGDGKKGYWHVVFSASLDNGTNVTGAALVTAHCQFFDLAVGGTWIGGRMDAGLVDAALRQKK